MQCRLVTMFTVFIGICRQSRWILNRRILRNLSLRTILEIRSGEISERKLLRIVNIALNTGIALSDKAVSLEDIFFEVYNKVSPSNEFDKNREYRFSLDTL